MTGNFMEELLKYLNSREQLAAAILAIFAVGFGKILEKFLKKDVENLDETLQVRKALREEVDALHKDVKELRVEVDEWRAKYWEQIQTNAHHQSTILQLQGEVLDLKLELTEYKRHNIKLTEKLSNYFPDDAFHRTIHDSTHPISDEYPTPTDVDMSITE